MFCSRKYLILQPLSTRIRGGILTRIGPNCISTRSCHLCQCICCYLEHGISLCTSQDQIPGVRTRRYLYNIIVGDEETHIQTKSSNSWACIDLRCNLLVHPPTMYGFPAYPWSHLQRYRPPSLVSLARELLVLKQAPSVVMAQSSTKGTTVLFTVCL